MPILVGTTAIIPPPTPLLAGTPDAHGKLAGTVIHAAGHEHRIHIACIFIRKQPLEGFSVGGKHPADFCKVAAVDRD